jgi:succinyl-CoA synthetase beta subunit
MNMNLSHFLLILSPPLLPSLAPQLVTKQNAGGIICNKVYLMERIYMRRELYLSILMDRGSGGPLLVASPFGGTSIEDVAASNPNAIFQIPIPIESREIPADIKAKMAENLGFELGAKGRDKVSV